MKKDFFTKNISLKIFSLLLAIVVWFVVLNIQNPVSTLRLRNIPVEIINADHVPTDGLYIANLHNNTIQVVVKGPILSIQNISRNLVKAQVDLKDYALKKGEIKVPIKEVLGLPRDISYERPEDLVLHIESLQTKQKSIEVTVEGTTKKDFIHQTPVIEPNTIELQGPESKMEKISRVIVNVSVENKENNVVAKVPITVLDAEGNKITGLESSVQSIRVEVPILKTKKIPLKYELKGQLPTDYRISKEMLEPKEITIAGKPENLGMVKEISIGSIDISGISEDKVITADILPPPGITLIDKTKSAQLKIGVEKVVTRQIAVPLVVENLSPNLKVSSAPEFIQILAKGTEEDLTLVLEKIKAVVDLTGKVDGIYNLTVELREAANIQVVEQENAEVVLDKQEQTP